MSNKLNNLKTISHLIWISQVLTMFRGYNKPSRQNIFGPSSNGGMRQNSLYMRGEGLPFNPHQAALFMHGEGLGSIFGSIFRRIVPLATKAVKKVASSKILREAGKQVLDTGVSAAANVAANAISGDKTVGEAASEELQNARKEIGNAIRNANLKRTIDDDDDDLKTTSKKKIKKRRKKSVVSTKRKQFRHSVFDDDDDDE